MIEPLLFGIVLGLCSKIKNFNYTPICITYKGYEN